jgi:hypothetical protein
MKLTVPQMCLALYFWAVEEQVAPRTKPFE